MQPCTCCIAALSTACIVQLQHRLMFAPTVRQTACVTDTDMRLVMTYVNSTRAASGSFQNRLAAVAKHVRAALVRRRIYNQTARELNALTDRELADLGIHRADIPQIALEAARGK